MMILSACRSPPVRRGGSHAVGLWSETPRLETALGGEPGGILMNAQIRLHTQPHSEVQPRGGSDCVRAATKKVFQQGSQDAFTWISRSVFTCMSLVAFEANIAALSELRIGRFMLMYAARQRQAAMPSAVAISATRCSKPALLKCKRRSDLERFARRRGRDARPAEGGGRI